MEESWSPVMSVVHDGSPRTQPSPSVIVLYWRSLCTDQTKEQVDCVERRRRIVQSILIVHKVQSVIGVVCQYHPQVLDVMTIATSLALIYDMLLKSALRNRG